MARLCSQGECRDLLHRRRLAGEVHGKHRADPQVCPQSPMAAAMWFGAHQSGIGIDIGEQHLGAGQANGIGGGEKGDRRHDRGIAGSEPDAHRGEVQRRGAAGAGDGAPARSTASASARSKAATTGPVVRNLAAQHRLDRGDVVVVDAMPAVGQERRHAVSISRRICSWLEPLLVGVAGVAEALRHRLPRRWASAARLARPKGGSIT